MIGRMVAAALAAALALGATPAAAQDCNRACLQGLVTQYVDAVLAHDPSRLPLADTVTVTEDGHPSKLGEGFWQGISGKGTFRHDYLDTARQVAAAHIHLLKGQTPVMVNLALHVKGGRISGVETVVHELTPDSPFQPAVLGQPIRGMDTPVPAGKRMARKDMVAVALRYAEGLRIGNFIDAGVPFAPETYRVENGVITAGEGCRMGGECGLTRQRIMVHPGLIPSVVAVDEENGTVLLWMNFGYTGSYGQDKCW